MSYGRYLGILVSTTALFVGVVVAINLVVDPYDIIRLIRVSGFNDNKASEYGFARLHKQFDLRRRHYDGIALGASHVERGIDTNNSALTLQGLKLYNGGLSGASMSDQAILFRHAVEVSGIKFALIALDLTFYGASGSVPAWNRWYGFGEYIKTLVSNRALVDSIATVIASRSDKPELQHGPDGLLNVEEFEEARGVSGLYAYERFQSVNDIYLNAVEPELRARAAILRDEGFDHSALRDILATAHRAGVRLYFFITPSHSRQFEIIHMLGLSSLYQQWVRELACELALDPHQDPEQPFSLWDFSGYNSVTTEPVPALHAKAAMRWYFDPVHYKPALGRLIIDLVLGLPSAKLSEIDDFGARITLNTLDAHFDAIERNRRQYVTGQPDIFSDLVALNHNLPQATNTVPVESPPSRPCPVPARKD